MDRLVGTDFFADRGFRNTLAWQQAPISLPGRRNADGRIEPSPAWLVVLQRLKNWLGRSHEGA
jgi:hypothetical protein